MAEMSVADASTVLGVTGRQADRLALAVDVAVTRRVGRSL
jgi:hypothetical protein